MTENKFNSLFELNRTLKGVKFGWQGAFQIQDWFVDHNIARTSNAIDWCSDFRSQESCCNDFRIVERFLLDKQLFFSGEAPIPSCPPTRGRLKEKIDLNIKSAKTDFSFKASVDFSVFESQRILFVFIYFDIDSINLDELIFIKEIKWFKFDYAKTQSIISVSAIGSCNSVYDLMKKILTHLNINSFFEANWPIFDYVQLSDVGPSVSRGPNLDARLDIQEHWGLLSGDEGYRLIDYEQDDYEEILSTPEGRFRGRYVFLYNFFPTSCLAFYDRDIDSKRTSWATYYASNVSETRDLVDYIGFRTNVPCLTDGIPIMIEICFIRYIELKRVDNIIESKSFTGKLFNLFNRFSGKTPLESAVDKLHRLDLYQDSSLWIIGGEYTDNLFEYRRLKNRIEKSIDHRRSISNEMRTFIIGLLSFFVGLIALLETLKLLE